MKPNILDRNWKYTPAAKTNIRRTFARIRREQKEREKDTIVQFMLKKTK